jgi:hypothetical protein
MYLVCMEGIRVNGGLDLRVSDRRTEVGFEAPCLLTSADVLVLTGAVSARFIDLLS